MHPNARDVGQTIGPFDATRTQPSATPNCVRTVAKAHTRTPRHRPRFACHSVTPNAQAPKADREATAMAFMKAFREMTDELRAYYNAAYGTRYELGEFITRFNLNEPYLPTETKRD